MSKRKIIGILCLVMVLTVGVFNENINAKNDCENYKGTVNLSLNEDGSNMMSNIQDATIFITKASYENNELNINASVSYENKDYPLQLTTQLRKSLTVDDMLVGSKSYDNYNNFNVVYVSILKNSQNKNCYVTNKNADNNNDIIQIYLMKKDTREFLMFELPLDLLSGYIRTINYDVPEIENVKDEHWWINVLKPIIKNKKLKSITPKEPYEDDRYFNTVLYNGPRDCYKYTIELKASATINSYNGQTEADDRSNLKMVEQKYYYNGTECEGNFLGVYNCCVTPVLTSSNFKPKDTIRSLTYGNNVHVHKGGLSISPGLWVGKLVGASIEWELYSTYVKSSGYTTFDDEEVYRGSKITMVDALLEEKDKYSIGITKKNEGQQSGKISGFTYTFDIGFCASEALDDGVLTVAGSYE